jgi:hypothetical protein
MQSRREPRRPWNPLMWQSVGDSLFSTLPNDLTQELIRIDFELSLRDLMDSDIGKALHHAAYARKEDADALLAMLEKNPALLLDRAAVKGPGGDIIVGITIYELLLGAGNYELAKKAGVYFSQLDNGEEERIGQYERYQPHIEGMLTETPYDLSPLVELIKKATPKEIKTLLKKDMTGINQELCEALLKFRKDWAPRIILNPCMHYNYASLKHALEILANEANNLYQSSGNNFDKIDLVWRQLIGFEMRRLPGIDRCIMAQSLYDVIQNKADIKYSYEFNEKLGGVADFPITDSDDSLDGLGGDFAVDIFAAPRADTSPRIC